MYYGIVIPSHNPNHCRKMEKAISESGESVRRESVRREINGVLIRLISTVNIRFKRMPNEIKEYIVKPIKVCPGLFLKFREVCKKWKETIDEVRQTWWFKDWSGRSPSLQVDQSLYNTRVSFMVGTGLEYRSLKEIKWSGEVEYGFFHIEIYDGEEIVNDSMDIVRLIGGSCISLVQRSFSAYCRAFQLEHGPNRTSEIPWLSFMYLVRVERQFQNNPEEPYLYSALEHIKESFYISGDMLRVAQKLKQMCDEHDARINWNQRLHGLVIADDLAVVDFPAKRRRDLKNPGDLFEMLMCNIDFWRHEDVLEWLFATNGLFGRHTSIKRTKTKEYPTVKPMEGLVWRVVKSLLVPHNSINQYTRARNFLERAFSGVWLMCPEWIEYMIGSVSEAWSLGRLYTISSVIQNKNTTQCERDSIVWILKKLDEGFCILREGKGESKHDGIMGKIIEIALADMNHVHTTFSYENSQSYRRKGKNKMKPATNMGGGWRPVVEKHEEAYCGLLKFLCNSGIELSDKDLKRISVFRGDYVKFFQAAEAECLVYISMDIAYAAASNNNRAIFEHVWAKGKM